MPVSMNNTQVVFNDTTAQTTAGVTSIVAGTGISSSGGLTPTIANTGVTSIVAGTGISISGGTGAVTVTNSNPNQLTATTGSPGYFGARAWVNFNGTGTVAIRASVNVSSITDNGTGRYTVNFTTAMPDVNFVTNLSSNGNDDSFGIIRGFYMVRSRATGSVQVQMVSSGGVETDSSYVAVAVFR